jgi:uncharacterized oligopeptide transporter (OPT) family protein
LIGRSLRRGLADYRGGLGHAAAGRTQQDLSAKVVGIGIVGLLAAITLAPSLQMNLVGALLIVLFGFLFVAVSSRLTGEIGSSSNPVSGMTIATLLVTCLVFLALGWTGPAQHVTALSVGAIVCIAASNGGSTSQDLKTGFLVGATPRLQQQAILIGCLASALLLGPLLLGMNRAATVYLPAADVAPGLRVDAAALSADTTPLAGPQGVQDPRRYRSWHKPDDAGGPRGHYLVADNGQAVYYVDPGINGHHATRPDGTRVQKYDAPKATLMASIIQGILGQRLPWALVLLGVAIALVLELAGVASLPFAVGVYLPLSSSAPILVGGLLRHLADRRQRRASAATLSEAESTAESDKSPGVLLASGYIAGGALAGIVIALLAGVLPGVDAFFGAWATAHNPFFDGPRADALSLLPFVAIAAVLGWCGRRRVPSA